MPGLFIYALSKNSQIQTEDECCYYLNKLFCNFR
jgi:hypothetical protein